MHNTYFVVSHGLVLQLLGKPLSLDCRVIQLGVGIHNLLLTGEQLEPFREAGHRAVPLGEGTHDLGVVHDEGWVDALNLYEVSHQLWCVVIIVCVCVSFHAHYVACMCVSVCKYCIYLIQQSACACVVCMCVCVVCVCMLYIPYPAVCVCVCGVHVCVCVVCVHAVYTLSSSLADVLGGLHSTPCFKQSSFKNFWKSKGHKANTHASNTHTFRLFSPVEPNVEGEGNVTPNCFSSSGIIGIRRNGGVKSTSNTCAHSQDIRGHHQ